MHTHKHANILSTQEAPSRSTTRSTTRSQACMHACMHTAKHAPRRFANYCTFTRSHEDQRPWYVLVPASSLCSNCTRLRAESWRCQIVVGRPSVGSVQLLPNRDQQRSGLCLGFVLHSCDVAVYGWLFTCDVSSYCQVAGGGSQARTPQPVG